MNDYDMMLNSNDPYKCSFGIIKRVGRSPWTQLNLRMQKGLLSSSFKYYLLVIDLAKVEPCMTMTGMVGF